jgi:hypothetical protein
MAHFYIAYIAPGDYEAFRRILHSHIADTYDEWSQFYLNKASNLLAKGHTYRDVQIDPDEFARYCDAHREERTLHGLDNFATRKAADNTER